MITTIWIFIIFALVVAIVTLLWCGLSMTKVNHNEIDAVHRHAYDNRKRLIKLEEQSNQAYVELLGEIKELRKPPEKSNYITQTAYYSGTNIICKGEYVIYTNQFNKGVKIVRKIKSWEDKMESCENNTFAGVVKKQIQGPGLVEIYAYQETNAQQD